MTGSVKTQMNNQTHKVVPRRRRATLMKTSLSCQQLTNASWKTSRMKLSYVKENILLKYPSIPTLKTFRRTLKMPWP